MIHERNERFGATGAQEGHGHSLRRRWWALAVILSLLVFIGDALREAFDPRG